MLTFIKELGNALLDFIKDDPVRPEIPPEFRVNSNRFIVVLMDDGKPASIVCVSLHNFIPASVDDLCNTVDTPDTAVFYTIWSYRAGSGAQLLREAVRNIQERYPKITTFVTLSPKTELAKRFHLKNGAVVFRENDLTVNYKYSSV